MRYAWALIGIGFIIIFCGLYILQNTSHVTTTSSGESVMHFTSSNATTTMTKTFSISSPEFVADAGIPPRYTCDGDQTSPPLLIRNIPDGARSLALIMDDPDVPQQLVPSGEFVHWVLFNIPVPAAGGEISIGMGQMVGTPGANSSGLNEYTGPCPPRQYEPSTHRYYFKLYALDNTLSLSAGATKAQVEAAMDGHVLAEASLMGTYKRR